MIQPCGSSWPQRDRFDERLELEFEDEFELVLDELLELELELELDELLELEFEDEFELELLDCATRTGSTFSAAAGVLASSTSACVTGAAACAAPAARIAVAAARLVMVTIFISHSPLLETTARITAAASDVTLWTTGYSGGALDDRSISVPAGPASDALSVE